MPAELFILIVDTLLFFGFIAVICWIVYVLIKNTGKDKKGRKH
jgi:hypothetical protein